MSRQKIPAWLLPAAALLLAAAVITAGWRLAGGARLMADRDGGENSPPPTAGPLAPAFCGPLRPPPEPPPIESAFGYHLYAGTPFAARRHLPVMEAARRLVREQAPPGNEDEHAASEQAAQEDVQTVVLLLEEYRRSFGAMPLGELNEEIVRRLQGENPKGLVVLPPDHPNLSPAGELLDRWGTPYRFHPESAWLTTVRSAGPDREMWTADDLLSEDTPPDPGSALTAGF